LVARSWIYTGTETQDVPVGIAALFTFATVGLLTAALSALAGRDKAVLAGIVLLGTTSFIKLGAAQYADMPIAFFFLASIVLACMQDRLPMSGAVLLGISAALAAWTKNEGLLFFALLLIAMKWTKQPVSPSGSVLYPRATGSLQGKPCPSKLSRAKRRDRNNQETDESIALRAGRSRIRLPPDTFRRPAP
jgi:hypothetical protein